MFTSSGDLAIKKIECAFARQRVNLLRYFYYKDSRRIFNPAWFYSLIKEKSECPARHRV